MKYRQSGFTLIELIVVLVILGILAANAVPRFADLTDDAEKAAGAAILGAISSSAAILLAQNLGTASSMAAIMASTDFSGVPASTTLTGTGNGSGSTSESGGSLPGGTLACGVGTGGTFTIDVKGNTKNLQSITLAGALCSG